MRILVVEDDVSLGRVLRRGLTDDGHAVDLEATVSSARHAIENTDYDLVVLDLSLPDGDGLVLCRELRENSATMPLLILTARGSVADKVGGLDAGADDYLTKPFDFPELSARVRALLRRPTGDRAPTVTAGSLVLDPAAHRVTRDGVLIPLTAREFALLHLLMTRAGDVVSRSDILEHVWDAHYGGISNVVDVHIRNLRRKLGSEQQGGEIQTVRGAGYRILP